MPGPIAKDAGREAARLVLVALLLVGCSSPPERPSVLLLVADTLRADHLGAYGYPLGTSPNLDRFAAESLKFDYAISAAPWTSPSMASIFTGHYPTAHGVTQHVGPQRVPDDAISADFVTLAEVLREAGYRTAGITANAWVSAARGYAQGFDRFDTIDYSKAPDVTALAFERLERLRASPPFLLYLHYMDPHPPLQPPRELAQRFRRAQSELPESRLPPSRAERERLARYDGEIFTLDQSLGALFEHLKRLGLYEPMVIAFVSDHGIPFLEHGVRRHGRKLHNEDTHVPLLLKLPGRRGEVDQTVSTIDLYPTLLHALGLEPPPGLQGVSLLAQLDERKRRGAFSENTVAHRNHRSLVTHDARKLILAFGKRAHQEVSEEDEEGVVGLFRSRDDYFERSPVEDEAQVAELRGRLWETYRESLEIHRGVAPARTELSPETVEELRKLGYVE